MENRFKFYHSKTWELFVIPTIAVYKCGYGSMYYYIELKWINQTFGLSYEQKVSNLKNKWQK